jgi:hypothetical protein
MKSTRLFHYVIKTNKEDSSFLYFTLEANDNLCFYSTLDYPVGSETREIDIKGALNSQNDFLSVMQHLKQKIQMEILLEEIIDDLVD